LIPLVKKIPNDKGQIWFTLALVLIIGAGTSALLLLDQLALNMAVTPHAYKNMPPRQATISAVGDLLVGYGWMGAIQSEIHQSQNDEAALEYPFIHVKSHFKGITFGNLEGPVTQSSVTVFKDKNEPFYFKAPYLGLKSLALAGFDVLSVANNHIKDCGEAGLLETLKLCKKAGLQSVGAGASRQEAFEPVFIRQGRMKVAFLAFDMIKPASVWATPDCPGAAHGEPTDLYMAVCQARQMADAVVVSLHWGLETPRDDPAEEPLASQRRLARVLIDAGASVILGHHSHALGKVEEYRQGVIFYSLGNFVFAGTTKAKHKTSAIAQIGLQRDGVAWYSLVPVHIEPPVVRYQPRVLDNDLGAAVVARVLSADPKKYLPWKSAHF
jgi:hypothetical protein